VTHAVVSADDRTETSLRLSLTGEIDLSNADDVENQILDHTSNQLSEVLVDLSGLTYLDSAGLRILFTLVTRMDTSQIGLELVVPPDSPINGAIQLTGLSTVVPVLPAPRNRADGERPPPG
jgi:anti-anti-sigma factor